MIQRIAYVGIDLLTSALKTILEEGCQVLKLYTCPTDNRTEFNVEVQRIAAARGIPVSVGRVTPQDLEELAGQGCELLICAGYYYRLPVTNAFPMVNIHPAPLPAFRGSWPMPVMLLRGERQGGVALHRMETSFDTGEILLQQGFPLEPEETLAGYMDRVEQILPGMVRQLVHQLPQLLENARPQGEGAYWPCPTEQDWTVRPDMPAARADAILRAFYGYECIYQQGARRFELIGGRVFPQPETDCAFPVQGGWIRALQVRELMPDA